MPIYVKAVLDPTKGSCECLKVVPYPFEMSKPEVFIHGLHGLSERRDWVLPVEIQDVDLSPLIAVAYYNGVHRPRAAAFYD